MTEPQKPICEAQFGGMMCGRPVEKWGQQCEYHDPKGKTRGGSDEAQKPKRESIRSKMSRPIPDPHMPLIDPSYAQKPKLTYKDGWQIGYSIRVAEERIGLRPYESHSQPPVAETPEPGVRDWRGVNVQPDWRTTNALEPTPTETSLGFVSDHYYEFSSKAPEDITAGKEPEMSNSLLEQAIEMSGNEFAMGYNDSGCFWSFYAGDRGAGSMIGKPAFISESAEPLEALREYLASQDTATNKEPESFNFMKSHWFSAKKTSLPCEICGRSLRDCMLRDSEEVLMSKEPEPGTKKKLAVIRYDDHVKLILPGYKQNRYLSKHEWDEFVWTEYKKMSRVDMGTESSEPLSAESDDAKPFPAHHENGYPQAASLEVGELDQGAGVMFLAEQMYLDGRTNKPLLIERVERFEEFIAELRDKSYKQGQRDGLERAMNLHGIGEAAEDAIGAELEQAELKEGEKE